MHSVLIAAGALRESAKESSNPSITVASAGSGSVPVTLRAGGQEFGLQVAFEDVLADGAFAFPEDDAAIGAAVALRGAVGAVDLNAHVTGAVVHGAHGERLDSVYFHPVDVHNPTLVHAKLIEVVR